jgi:hypothetical protein
MGKSKRQIIKTKPQRPYIVARIVLMLIVVIAIVLGALFFSHPHGAHALGRCSGWGCSTMLQEAHLGGRRAPIQASLERFAHEVLH